MRPTPLLSVLALALAACAARPPAPAVEIPVTAPASAAAPQLLLTRDQSPWSGYTEPGEEQAGRRVAALPDLAGLEPVAQLAKYSVDGTPLIAIDRANRRVVLSASHFGELERVDATRLKPGESKTVGTVRSAALLARPRDLALFLLESQLVETFWHVEARLALAGEQETPQQYRASFSGHHVYFTNERNQDPLSFAVVLDKESGALSVVGQ